MAPRRYIPITDGTPHRPWASLNVRPEEKRRLDMLQAWHGMEEGRDLSQWDVFSLILAYYVDHSPDVPDEMRRLLRTSHPM